MKTHPIQRQDKTPWFAANLKKFGCTSKWDLKQFEVPQNASLLGNWSIYFVQNNLCLLQFSLPSNAILRDAIRAVKIKQLKKSRGIHRRPLIPISFIGSQHPTCTIFDFLEWFGGFNFKELEPGCVPICIQRMTRMLGASKHLNCWVLCETTCLIHPTWIYSLKPSVRFSPHSASCPFLAHLCLHLPELPFTPLNTPQTSSPCKQPPPVITKQLIFNCAETKLLFKLQISLFLPQDPFNSSPMLIIPNHRAARKSQAGWRKKPLGPDPDVKSMKPLKLHQFTPTLRFGHGNPVPIYSITRTLPKGSRWFWKSNSHFSV